MKASIGLRQRADYKSFRQHPKPCCAPASRRPSSFRMWQPTRRKIEKRPNHSPRREREALSSSPIGEGGRGRVFLQLGGARERKVSLLKSQSVETLERRIACNVQLFNAPTR